MAARGAPSVKASSADPALATQADFVIADARAGNSPSGIAASDVQIAILGRIRLQGEVTWEDTTESIGNASAYLEARGFWLTVREPYLVDGFAIPTYTWAGPTTYSADEMAAIGDPCIEGEGFYVESLFATQPQAVATQDEWYNTHMREPMVACLARNGIVAEPDATASELNVMAYDFLDSYLASNGGDLDTAIAVGADCWGEADSAANRS